MQRTSLESTGGFSTNNEENVQTMRRLSGLALLLEFVADAVDGMQQFLLAQCLVEFSAQVFNMGIDRSVAHDASVRVAQLHQPITGKHGPVAR